MTEKSRLAPLVAAFAVAVLALGPASAQAETRTVRIAKQFGISYLPLTVMEEKNLLEEHGRKLGLDLKTEWVQFVSGTPMNEAIISGNLELIDLETVPEAATADFAVDPPGSWLLAVQD